VVFFVIAVGGPASAQSPSASASLSQGQSFGGEATLWICEGFAASSEPWLTASAELRLKADNQVIQSTVYSANFWGSTYQVSDFIEAAG